MAARSEHGRKPENPLIGGSSRALSWRHRIALSLGVIGSALGINYASSLDGVAQTLLVLISLVIVFFASHPLGHFLWARAYGVRTQYFFLGRSDFRKLPSRPASLLGGLVPTIGTKLVKEDLARLAPRRRGYIFGAGVIMSNSLMGLELLYVLVAGFGLLAALGGSLLFVATLATELLFSTKVGDLSKMAREFKARNRRQTLSPPP